MPTDPKVASGAFNIIKTGSPKVSVVVPTYKASATLHEAVMSLLQQDFQDLEVIVVDDACPENSSRVVQNISDPRLRILRLQENRGLSGARNAGIEMADGEHIAFLDADDTSLPYRIRLQSQLLDNRPDVGLVGGLHNRMDQAGNIMYRAADIWRVPDSALRPLLLFTNPFTSAVMIRKSAMPEYGYRTMLAEDYDMTGEVARNHAIAMLRVATINYRVNPKGIMAAQRETVASGAASVKRKLLDEVGLQQSSYTEALLFPRLQLDMASEPKSRVTFLEQYRLFLIDVFEANNMSRVYAPLDLQMAISTHWANLLHQASQGKSGLPLGFNVIRIFAAFWPLYAAHFRFKGFAHICVNAFCRPFRV
jgi:GT2 family glycosyltransferase